jgi:hypothetical protein
MCTPQASEGGSCQNEYECLNNMGCDKTYGTDDGICTKYYSVKSGSKVKACISGLMESSNKLCTSGVCVPDDPSRNLGGTCVDNAVSKAKNAVCTQNEDCTGTRGTDTLTGICSCGYSSGKAYCELFSGDTEPLAALSILRTHIQSHAIHLCHTSNRVSDGCMAKSLSPVDQYTYATNQKFSMYSVLLVDNSDCVKSTLTDIYWGMN